MLALLPKRIPSIHNWPLQPFCQDYGLASHTTYVVCVHFIRKWRSYSLTSTANARFLRNFFMAGLFTVRVFTRNLPRGNRRRNILFFYISFRCLTWDTKPGFTSNKPTHYLLDYGHFFYIL